MKLAKTFYERSVLAVAADLIGKVLVRQTPHGPVSGMIVETEAYDGTDDLACHASKGRTARTGVMFGPAGRAYVFMIYGVYYCLNAVTGAEGHPAAVLIRAMEPLGGREIMRQYRPRAARDVDLGSGPGKLCQALAIDRDLNAADLAGPRLWIEDRRIVPGRVLTSPRIGVDYAGSYRDKPWRFFLEDSPYVSRSR